MHNRITERGTLWPQHAPGGTLPRPYASKCKHVHGELQVAPHKRKADAGRGPPRTGLRARTTSLQTSLQTNHPAQRTRWNRQNSPYRSTRSDMRMAHLSHCKSTCPLRGVLPKTIRMSATTQPNLMRGRTPHVSSASYLLQFRLDGCRSPMGARVPSL